MTTKYTFLLPAYKAKFFEESLISIKNQTYTDFICIVSDDCSPEDLKTIYEKNVGDDPRFSYRRNQENMGSKSLVSHWNLLVDICKTDYLIMASDDDVYKPEFLEEMNKLTGKYPEVGVLRAKTNRIDENGNVLFEDIELPEFENGLDGCLSIFSREGYIHCMQNNVFKTSELRETYGCVDLPLAWFSDDATVMACSRYGMVNSQKTLFLFRTSEYQISLKRKVSNTICKKKFYAGVLFVHWLQSDYRQLYKKTNYLDKLESTITRAAQRAAGVSTDYYRWMNLWSRIKYIPLIYKTYCFDTYTFIKLGIVSMFYN